MMNSSTKYVGRRVEGGKSKQGRSAVDFLKNPQIGAKLLAACYLTLTASTVTGFYLGYSLIMDDVTSKNDVSQGFGLTVGIALIISTGIVLTVFSLITRSFWFAVRDTKVHVIRRYSLGTTVLTGVGLIGLAFYSGVNVFQELLPGATALLLIFFLFASVLTLATNRSVID